MSDNFKLSLEQVLKHEGGWADHPADPGGATMKGVTLKTYSTWLKRSATKEELRAIPDAHLQAIYREMYWDRIKGNDLAAISPGLAACVFDFAVNSGPGRAARALQGLSKATPDGAIGPATLKQVQTWVNFLGPQKAIEAYQTLRQHYLESLDTFATFGRGWTTRVAEMTDYGKKLG